MKKPSREIHSITYITYTHTYTHTHTHTHTQIHTSMFTWVTAPGNVGKEMGFLFRLIFSGGFFFLILIRKTRTKLF